MKKVKIMKKILLILLFLVIVNITMASEYKVEYYEEYKDSYLTGEINLGRVILTKEIINGITHNYTISVSNYIMEKGDIFCNKENESLNIVSEKLLLTNECYSNFEVGVYTLQYLSSNVTSYLEIVNPENPRIFFDDEYSPFPLNFSKNDFTFNNTEEEIIINMTLPTFLLPSTYHIMYKCNNDTLTKDINVRKNIKWNITNYNNSKQNIYIGTVGNFTEITIINKGNTHTKLKIDFIGEGAKFLISPEAFISYPNTNLTFGISYDANSEFVAKGYNVTLRITDDDNNKKEINYEFNVEDSVLPVLKNVRVNGKLEATREFNYNLNVKDNAGIKSCMVDVFYGNKNVFSELKNGTHTSENMSFKMMFEQTGPHHFKIECLDIYDNSVKKEDEYVIEKLNSFIYETPIKIKKVKVDTFTNLSFLNVTYKTDLTIELLNFVYDGNEFTFKFVNNGNVHLIKNINESLTIKDAVGLVTMEFMGNTVGDYEGRFKVNGIINSVNYDDIIFSGAVIDYEIPDPFKEEWLDGTIDCHYENVDDITLSETRCEIVRGGLMSRNDIGVPITLADKDKLHDSYTQTIDELKSKNTSKLIWNIIFFIVIIALSVYLIIEIKVSPIFRWRLYK